MLTSECGLSQDECREILSLIKDDDKYISANDVMRSICDRRNTLTENELNEIKNKASSERTDLEKSEEKFWESVSDSLDIDATTASELRSLALTAADPALSISERKSNAEAYDELMKSALKKAGEAGFEKEAERLWADRQFDEISCQAAIRECMREYLPAGKEEADLNRTAESYYISAIGRYLEALDAEKSAMDSTLVRQ